ncbi:glucose-6-phosphate isomerase [Catenuloplanes nepalensis]|uniref:Glucose-6-phosphate isomerase n=1 Tax=Catenuloplanes nepalensis TaxID=587533 RepID=A0ABT9ML33_9ACTN|nr:glucose-6-phosphate isomerase [Catenuloplanes nepalensis]MDP9792129.1 glucose-6-phosphate isomerase [Catenuloplanes nepalensis]
MSDLLSGGAEAAAGLAVHGARAIDEQSPASVRRALVADGVPGLLARKDPTLWGPEAESAAAAHLGWLDTFHRSRELLPQLAELCAELGDLDHVVLCGMGGSSLAPAAMAATLGRPLTVLDTTDPGQIRAALGDRLDTTVVVVASKSGSTIETDAQRRAYHQAFLDLGRTPEEAGRHFVIVTDPGSPLVETGLEMGAFVIVADPAVGGRFGALTAFGLVPAALAGVDVAELLDQAEEFAASLGGDEDNPALALGAAIGSAATAGYSAVALVPDGSGLDGLGAWVEQLLAESLGKDGLGLLPVVVDSPSAPGATGLGVLTVAYGGSLGAGAVPGGGVGAQLAVNGPLGAQFLAWEFATALAARVLGVDPFSQPDVASTKTLTTAALESDIPEIPVFVEGAVQVFAGTSASGETTVAGQNAAAGQSATPSPAAATSLADALRAVLDAGEYLAVMAYLDRHDDAEIARLRSILAERIGKPVTFGWGPRLLHTAGQFHKGGPRTGAFLQITGAVSDDLAIPGRPYTFGQLQAAQAAGDRAALHDRPLIRLHLTDRTAGINQLVTAAQAL